MSNNFEELEKLHNLKQKGILTEDEYISQKNAIISKMNVSEVQAAQNLWQTYTNVWRKYFTFSGRSSRYDYWGFYLVNFLISLGLSVLGMVAGIFSFFNGLYSLLIIIPTMALTWRRLHDTNRSGWWVGSLLILIPVSIVFAAASAVVNYAGATSSGFDTFKAVVYVVIALWLVIQLITILVFMFFKGDAGANKYGEPVAHTAAQDKTGKIISICFLVLYLILPIIGILSVGAISGYSKATSRYKSNKASDEIMMLATNTQTMFSTVGSYDKLNNSSALQLQLVPESMQKDGKIKNSFGGDVYIMGRGAFFMIEFTKVPANECKRFIASDWGSSLQTIMFDENISSCDDCPKEGCPMIWVYN